LELAKKPIWVDDEPLISNILSKFVDKLDKHQTRISIKVSRKLTPELFDFNVHDCEHLWSLVEELETTYKLISINKKKSLPSEVQYIDAVIRFELTEEILLRAWMGRPIQDDYKKVWEEGCSNIANDFQGSISSLREAKLSHSLKSAKEILESFEALSIYLANSNAASNTLRALSARFFWGDSKFLDTKQDLITGIFPEYKIKIITRTLLINISLPKKLEKVLFIENQDTFLQLAERQSKSNFLNNFALVYCAGFKGSASRIRDKNCVVFSKIGMNDNVQVMIDFETMWFGSGKDLECYFWGDLDFSGFGILSSIKKQFPNLIAWKLAYNLMQQMLEKGLGHSPEETSKVEQRDPGETGCEFSDTELLPKLRKINQFIDQEAVFVEQLVLD
jgi:hypothetical protein